MALTKVSRGLLSTSIVDNGNATAITIDSSEQVGIGTSSPQYVLDVDDPSGNAYIAINRATQSQGEVGFKLGGGTSGDDWYIYQPTSTSNLSFYKAGDKVTINSSGNLLVGKTAPDYNTAGIEIDGSNDRLFVTRAGTPVLINRKSSDGDLVSFYRDTASVGSIGTAGSQIYIGTGASGLFFNSSTNQIYPLNTSTQANEDGTQDLGRSTARFKDLWVARTHIANSSTSYWTLDRDDSDGSLTFDDTGSERMRIDSSGRLLVNTSSILTGSGAKLQVLQTVGGQWSQRTNNSTSSPYGMAIDYVSANPNGTANQFIYCTTTAGARFAVYSNGGVGNYSGNNVNLSDRNAKKDITLHTDDEWNCVKAWEIVDYRYNDEADDSPAKIGVIAQQIQEHCPDLVNVFQEQADAVEEVLGEDGEVVTEAKAAVEERIGVNEAQMMWKVTKAFQEAMERIETLEAKVQQLENT